MLLVRLDYKGRSLIYHFLVIVDKCSFGDVEELSCSLVKMIAKDGALLGVVLINLLYWECKELGQASSTVLVFELWAEYSQGIGDSVG